MELTGQFNVEVVCPVPEMDKVVRKIRDWCIEGHKPTAVPAGFHSLTRIQVNKWRHLIDAIQAARDSPRTSVLIPIGFSAAQVTEVLSSDEESLIETVIRPPRPESGHVDEQPTASLYGRHSIVLVQDTIPALRKALLRLQHANDFEVRPIRTRDEYCRYFQIRYEVWREMGYIRPEIDHAETDMELDYTDRTAYAVGLFRRDDKKHDLIGCARLVYPLGQEVPRIDILQQILDEAGDHSLKKLFEYPRRLSHPFDLLESFKGFRKYYAKCLQEGKRKAELSRVVIAADYRGKGLGEALVDSTVAVAKSRRLNRLFLACHHRHREFYRRCGFYPLEGLTCEHFSGVDAPALAMQCDL